MENPLAVLVWVDFWTRFYSPALVSAVTPKPHGFAYCSFVGSFEIRKYLHASSFLVLFQHRCRYVGPLYPYEFEDDFSISAQGHGASSRGCTEAAPRFLRYCCHSDRVPPQEHRRNIHLFRVLSFLSAVLCFVHSFELQISYRRGYIYSEGFCSFNALIDGVVLL